MLQVVLGVAKSHIPLFKMSAFRRGFTENWLPVRHLTYPVKSWRERANGISRRSLTLINTFEEEPSKRDSEKNHALVFGASGISGWSIVNQLLTDSLEARKFSKISAVTVRPITAEKALWPDSPRLKIYSGIDLVRNSSEGVKDVLKQRIPDIETVTHVFFNSKWNNS
jgi:hypothetical protein